MASESHKAPRGVPTALHVLSWVKPSSIRQHVLRPHDVRNVLKKRRVSCGSKLLKPWCRDQAQCSESILCLQGTGPCG